MFEGSRRFEDLKYGFICTSTTIEWLSFPLEEEEARNATRIVTKVEAVWLLTLYGSTVPGSPRKFLDGYGAITHSTHTLCMLSQSYVRPGSQQAVIGNLGQISPSNRIGEGGGRPVA